MPQLISSCRSVHAARLSSHPNNTIVSRCDLGCTALDGLNQVPGLSALSEDDSDDVPRPTPIELQYLTSLI